MLPATPSADVRGPLSGPYPQQAGRQSVPNPRDFIPTEGRSAHALRPAAAPPRRRAAAPPRPCSEAAAPVAAATAPTTRWSSGTSSPSASPPTAAPTGGGTPEIARGWRSRCPSSTRPGRSSTRASSAADGRALCRLLGPRGSRQVIRFALQEPISETRSKHVSLGTVFGAGWLYGCNLLCAVGEPSHIPKLAVTDPSGQWGRVLARPGPHCTPRNSERAFLMSERNRRSALPRLSLRAPPVA